MGYEFINWQYDKKDEPVGFTVAWWKGNTRVFKKGNKIFTQGPALPADIFRHAQSIIYNWVSKPLGNDDKSKKQKKTKRGFKPVSRMNLPNSLIAHMERCRFVGIEFYRNGQVGIRRNNIEINKGYAYCSDIFKAINSFKHTLNDYGIETLKLAAIKKQLMDLIIKLDQKAHELNTADSGHNLKSLEDNLYKIYIELINCTNTFKSSAADELNEVLDLSGEDGRPDFRKGKRHLVETRTLIDKRLKEIEGKAGWTQERLSRLEVVHKIMVANVRNILAKTGWLLRRSDKEIINRPDELIDQAEILKAFFYALFSLPYLLDRANGRNHINQVVKFLHAGNPKKARHHIGFLKKYYEPLISEATDGK